jgi:hypothetical protein
MLGNDLLFPDGISMADAAGGKEMFEAFLCAAPCNGPCHFDNYNGAWPDRNEGRWPNNFNCPNIWGWEGNRWDNKTDNGNYNVKKSDRRTNGLDYMALYNMYMLKYGTMDFYNPKSIKESDKLTISTKITKSTIYIILIKSRFKKSSILFKKIRKLKE